MIYIHTSKSKQTIFETKLDVDILCNKYLHSLNRECHNYFDKQKILQLQEEDIRPNTDYICTLFAVFAQRSD